MSDQPDEERYEILSKLAVGGMAEIFLAKQRALAGFERTVVIKRVLPELAQDEEFIGAFLDEARLCAKLSHSNIVQVIELGKLGETYFIAMEYVQGVDAGTLLHAHRRARTLLPIDVALSIACDLLSGLAFAHDLAGDDGAQLGLVHRDVSPSNLLIAFTGMAKVVDFGIAKATAKIEGRTRTGNVKGKLGYLAPEQLRLEPIDRRVDIFTAGIVLYELLTCVHPFRGAADLETMQAIATGEPIAVHLRRPDVPIEISQVVARALSKDPNTRFATATQMQAELEQAATKNGINISALPVQKHLADMRTVLDQLLSKKSAGAIDPSPAKQPQDTTREVARPTTQSKVKLSVGPVIGVAGLMVVAAMAAWLATRKETPDAAPATAVVAAPSSQPAAPPLARTPASVATIFESKANSRLGFGLVVSSKRILTARSVVATPTPEFRVRCQSSDTFERAVVALQSEELGLALLELSSDCLVPETLTWTDDLLISETVHTTYLDVDLPGLDLKTTGAYLPTSGDGPRVAIDLSQNPTAIMIGVPVRNQRNQILGILGDARCRGAAKQRKCVGQILPYPLVYYDEVMKGGYSPQIRRAARTWMNDADPLIR